jgi:hypothetical protein
VKLIIPATAGIRSPAATARNEPGRLVICRPPARQIADVQGCSHHPPGSHQVNGVTPARYHALAGLAVLAAAQVSVPVPQVTLSGLNPLALIGLAVWALVTKARVRLWHVLVAMAAGVALTGTIFGPDISVLLSQISGGYL